MVVGVATAYSAPWMGGEETQKEERKYISIAGGKD
jgi:hypothetical protein